MKRFLLDVALWTAVLSAFVLWAVYLPDTPTWLLWPLR